MLVWMHRCLQAWAYQMNFVSLTSKGFGVIHLQTQCNGESFTCHAQASVIFYRRQCLNVRNSKTHTHRARVLLCICKLCQLCYCKFVCTPLWQKLATNNADTGNSKVYSNMKMCQLEVRQYVYLIEWNDFTISETVTWELILDELIHRLENKTVDLGAKIFAGEEFHQAQLLLYCRCICFHQCGKGCHVVYVIINTGEKMTRRKFLPISPPALIAKKFYPRI